MKLNPGLGETVAWWRFRAEGPPKAQLRSEAGDGAPLARVFTHHPLLIPPPPGGLPGGGDRLSDETHYALNPPD